MPPRLPPATAQTAIVLGFLAGTWALVDGFHRIITGASIQLWNGYTGPWAAWGGAVIVLGALWMLAGNLYLFQNRLATWKGMVVLIVVSSWAAGRVMIVVLIAQLILMLLPSTRHGLRG